MSPASSKDPAATRQRLLETAFARIHRCGFQPTGLEAILEEAGLTKGAVYHHFGSKAKLGYAVFDELVVPWVRERWIDPVRAADDPLRELTARVRGLARRSDQERALGCPLNNLIQETGGVDQGFRARMNALLDEWRAQLARDLRRGQRAGRVRAGLRVHDTAAFLVSALEGVVGIAKPAADPLAYRRAVAGFVGYLESVRA